MATPAYMSITGTKQGLIPLFNARSPWLMPYTPTFSPAARFNPPVRIEPAHGG